MLKKLLTTLFVVLVLGLVVFFTAAGYLFEQQVNLVTAPPPYTVGSEAAALHNRLFVADLHADHFLWGRNLLRRYDYGHVDLPRLVDGHVALQVFSSVTQSPRGQNVYQNAGDSDRLTLFVMAQRWPVRTWFNTQERALYQAERLHRAAEHAAGQVRVIKTRGDLEAFVADRAADPTLVGGLLAMEGLHTIEGDVAGVDELYAAGYRMMAITHFFDTELGGSAHGMAKGGLTEAGRTVIRRQEDLGIVVDLAHVAPAAIDDILDLATKPMVVSHTGVQGTCPGPRNLSDAHIDGIAAGGGVIGIGYWHAAVCDITPESIVRAMRYVADRVGVAHVGLGSDFDGSVTTSFDTSGLAKITEALLAAGFSEADIRAIMGENVLRVLRATLPE